MTDILDTPAQRVTHSAPHGYAADVNPPTPESEHIREARSVQDEIDALSAQIKAKLVTRDQHIALAHIEDGLRPPEIARQLGDRESLSTSNVRTIIKFAKARQRPE